MDNLSNTVHASLDDELIRKAKTGYFVRSTDLERVYCPGGVLYKQYEEQNVHGNGCRYFNKEQCVACKYNNECYINKNGKHKNYRVVYFGKAMEKKTNFDIITGIENPIEQAETYMMLNKAKNNKPEIYKGNDADKDDFNIYEDKTVNNENDKTEKEINATETVGYKTIKIPTSSLPYGYQNENGRMTINESEAKVVRELFALYQDGNDTGMSSKEIANLFEQKGYKTRKGNLINTCGIIKIWRNKDIYLGKAVKMYGIYDPILKDYNENENIDIDSDIIPPVNKRKRGRHKSAWKAKLEKFKQIRKAEIKIAKLTNQKTVSDLLLQTETGFSQDVINDYRNYVLWCKGLKSSYQFEENTPASKHQLNEAEIISLVNDDEKQISYGDKSTINMNTDMTQAKGEQLITGNTDIDDLISVKRKRGRPKGSRNKTKSISSVKIDTAKPPVKIDCEKTNLLFEKPKITGKFKLELEIELDNNCKPQSTREMLLWLLSVIDSQNLQSNNNRSYIDHD